MFCVDLHPDSLFAADGNLCVSQKAHRHRAARFRDEDLADKWVEKSVEFIEQHKDEPLFLFFSSHDIHVPRMPHERFQGKTSLGFRGDAIVQLDWCVGELMKTLDRLKLSEKTLVVFCSDNGPVLDDGYKDGAIEKIGDHRAPRASRDCNASEATAHGTHRTGA